jgi:transcriptional regulator with XRE-family HTH domain
MADPTNVRTDSAGRADVRTLADRLRGRRKALAMTQMDVARELQVGQQTVGRWENGDVPQRRHWAAIASFLGLADESDVRSILAASETGATVVQLPGTHRLADVGSADPRQEQLLTAITQRVSQGPLSETEIAFLRELLGLLDGR